MQRARRCERPLRWRIIGLALALGALAALGALPQDWGRSYGQTLPLPTPTQGGPPPPGATATPLPPGATATPLPPGATATSPPSSGATPTVVGFPVVVTGLATPAAAPAAGGVPVSPSSATPGAAAAASGGGGASPPGPAGREGSLAARLVDWAAVLATDPRVQLESRCLPASPVAPRQLCVTVTLGSETLVGLVALDNALYGDLDGDGREEALLRVESGGTAGTIGLLVLRADLPRPRLVTLLSGYKLAARIVDDTLLVDQPWYFEGEPNCCPTAFLRTAYRLVGDQLRPTAVRWFVVHEGQEQAVAVAEVVVRGFYRALGEGRLSHAYAFLSPAYQAEHPFGVWAAEHTLIEGIDVTTRPGAAEDEVLVTLAITERPLVGTGAPRRLTGAWRLVPAEGAPLGWLLDQADLAPAP